MNNLCIRFARIAEINIIGRGTFFLIRNYIPYRSCECQFYSSLHICVTILLTYPLIVYTTHVCIYIFPNMNILRSAIRNIWTRVQEAIAKVAWMSQHYEISLPDWVFAFFERKSVYTVITEKNSKKLLRKILVILIV